MINQRITVIYFSLHYFDKIEICILYYTYFLFILYKMNIFSHFVTYITFFIINLIIFQQKYNINFID